MAYTRPFGQAQGASPWSSGVPPGLQQQHQQQAQQAQQVQPMFNQPMGAFDMSASWQGQQPAAQQWVQAPMQQVQFVPNPAYMQQPQMRQPMNQQQRPMHQRSLSASRIGANGHKRPMNSNFSGQQQHWQQNNNGNNNNNSNRQQQNNQYQQRVTRQQSRMNNQKGGQFNNNNNGTNNNNNNKQPNQQHQQQQQQQQKQQQPTKQAPRKGAVKVTKVKKQSALKAKQGNKAVVGNKVKNESTSNDAQVANVKSEPVATGNNVADQPIKAQSKTAERKQLKLQARKNAEALKQSKLPVAKRARLATSADGANVDQTADEPIDQAQLKCVPAVFGFVCKLCDVFLRDKIARREHIDSDEHMEKFKAFEEEEKAKQAEEAKVKEEKVAETTVTEGTATSTLDTNEVKDEKVTDEKVKDTEKAAESGAADAKEAV